MGIFNKLFKKDSSSSSDTTNQQEIEICDDLANRRLFDPRAIAKPPFNPLDRNRSLTPPLPITAVRQRTHAQLQSCLFALPRELRLQIWSYTIGCGRMYLTKHKEHLVQQPRPKGPTWYPKTRLLTVPLLCRAAYNESIHILYSETTFCCGFGPFSSKEVITDLEKKLLPDRIMSIRHLEIGWHFEVGPPRYGRSHWDLTVSVCPPDSDNMWKEVWKVVGRMKLKTLEVVLWLSGRGDRTTFGEPERERELLRPLMGLGCVNKMLLVLPWEKQSGGEDGNGRITVRRTFEDRSFWGVSVPVKEGYPTLLRYYE